MLMPAREIEVEIELLGVRVDGMLDVQDAHVGEGLGDVLQLGLLEDEVAGGDRGDQGDHRRHCEDEVHPRTRHRLAGHRRPGIVVLRVLQVRTLVSQVRSSFAMGTGAPCRPPVRAVPPRASSPRSEAALRSLIRSVRCAKARPHRAS